MRGRYIRRGIPSHETGLGEEIALYSTPVTSSFADDEKISIYWIPGCSSCVKLKELVAGHGLEYESINVLEQPAAMEDLTASGLRGVPVVRKGNRFAYGQSLDEVAEFLGVTNKHTKLPSDILLARWYEILEKTSGIVAAFDAEILRRRVIPQRERSIGQLCVHTYQVAESFLRQVEDDKIDAREIYLDPREDIKTKDGVLSYIESIIGQYRKAFLPANSSRLPAHLHTHYGQQPLAQVLERGAWHTAQHARQLDFVAAGIGFELQIPVELYSGLPLPKRLWG